MAIGLQVLGLRFAPYLTHNQANLTIRRFARPARQSAAEADQPEQQNCGLAGTQLQMNRRSLVGDLKASQGSIRDGCPFRAKNRHATFDPPRQLAPGHPGR